MLWMICCYAPGAEERTSGRYDPLHEAPLSVRHQKKVCGYRRHVFVEEDRLWTKWSPEVRRFVDNLGVGLCQKGSKDQRDERDDIREESGE